MKVVFSVQKVQNQRPLFPDRVLALVAEDATEIESQSRERGEASENAVIGVCASGTGEGVGNGPDLFGLRPERR